MSPLTTIFMLSLSVLHTKKGRMQASQFTHKPATRAVPLALSRDQGPREGLVMEGLVELRAHFANPLWPQDSCQRKGLRAHSKACRAAPATAARCKA